MDLDHPVETVFKTYDFTGQKSTGKYVCSICGYVYDPLSMTVSPLKTFRLTGPVPAAESRKISSTKRRIDGESHTKKRPGVSLQEHAPGRFLLNYFASAAFAGINIFIRFSSSA